MVKPTKDERAAQLFAEEHWMVAATNELADALKVGGRNFPRVERIATIHDRTHYSLRALGFTDAEALAFELRYRMVL